VFEYSHTSGTGFAIVGGYVYRGVAAPALSGAYVFGDAGSGRVFAWDRTSAPIDVGIVPALSSFGEDQRGEIYALALFDGTVYRIVQTAGGGGGGFPVLLSQTGLFSDVANLTPAAGMVEYSVAVPFWSDNASKRRWIALPAGSRAAFDGRAAWTLPPRTALVKHFEVPAGGGKTRRLETRVLLRQPASATAAARWVGVTYRWNLSQTDASLLTTALDEAITIDTGAGPQLQTYHYPAAFECLQCHNSAAGSVLGLRTAQMNRSFSYPGGTANQLTAWSCAGMLTGNPVNPAQLETLADPANPSIPRTLRSRAWLDVNCSMCHRPGGPAPGGLDLRRDPLLGAMNAIDALPTQGDLGISGARRILPGSANQSLLWARVQSTQAGVHMPPQGRAADSLAVSLLGDWINTDLFVLDSDADGRADASDDCPSWPNPDQADTDGNGIGNLCECGDQNGDGRVDVRDLVAVSSAIFNPSLATPLCDTNADDTCNVVDIVGINRRVFGAAALCARHPAP
jgi:uncharacterized repeat protein (TIGR03806 family)